MEAPAQRAVVRAPAAAARIKAAAAEDAAKAVGDGPGRKGILDEGACTARGFAGYLARPHSCTLCPTPGAAAGGCSVLLFCSLRTACPGSGSSMSQLGTNSDQLDDSVVEPEALEPCAALRTGDGLAGAS